MYLHVYIIQVYCIWPPAYKVDLKYEEDFVISEMLQKSDIKDVYDEEEMIQDTDLKLNLQNNAHKYYGLHKQATRFNNRKNKREDDALSRLPVKFSDNNPDKSSMEEKDNAPNYVNYWVLKYRISSTA